MEVTGARATKRRAMLDKCARRVRCRGRDDAMRRDAMQVAVGVEFQRSRSYVKRGFANAVSN